MTTTDSFTASPTPFGPPAAFMPLYAATIAAIVACYKGMNAKGGPKGVGDAVNESVVITFMLLFVVNFVMSAIYFQLVPPKTG